MFHWEFEVLIGSWTLETIQGISLNTEKNAQANPRQKWLHMAVFSTTTQGMKQPSLAKVHSYHLYIYPQIGHLTGMGSNWATAISGHRENKPGARQGMICFVECWGMVVKGGIPLWWWKVSGKSFHPKMAETETFRLRLRNDFINLPADRIEFEMFFCWCTWKFLCLEDNPWKGEVFGWYCWCFRSPARKPPGMYKTLLPGTPNNHLYMVVSIGWFQILIENGCFTKHPFIYCCLGVPGAKKPCKRWDQLQLHINCCRILVYNVIGYTYYILWLIMIMQSGLTNPEPFSTSTFGICPSKKVKKLKSS